MKGVCCCPAIVTRWRVWTTKSTTPFAITQWRFVSLRNGAVTASHIVHDGRSDGSGVQPSELARVNERLGLGAFTRINGVMRSDHQLSKVLRGNGMTRALMWNGSSAEVDLPDPTSRDAPTDIEQQRRCCDWQLIAVTATESRLAMLMRLACQFTSDSERSTSSCYVSDYSDGDAPRISEVVVAPIP